MINNLTFIGIIPARYASTRFPGKPLAMLGGMTMIERVFRQVSLVLDRVLVATDDNRIMAAVEAFGGQAVMTSTAAAPTAVRRLSSRTMVAEYHRQLIPKEIIQKSLDEFLRFLATKQPTT